MRRIRLGDLINFKRQRSRGGSVAAVETGQFRPLWENDYYHFKQQLTCIERTNSQILRLISQYYQNTTIFNLKQLQSLIKVNCRRIDELDHWTNNFPYTNATPIQNQLENNIVKHFKQSILKEIATVFRIKDQINSINQDINQSFSMNRSANMSFSVMSKAEDSKDMSQEENMQRNMAIKEVSAKIENLHGILRRMGDVVATQGDLVNRIDENLSIGHDNVRLGRELLAARAARQTCEQEEESTCNFSNKVNSVITTLYLINLALILVLVIKNL